AEDAQVRGVLNAEAGADGRGERHDGSSACVNELARGDQIIVCVRQHNETFFDQDAGSFDQLLSVREKRLLIADDFQLDPIGKPQLAPQPRSTNSLVSGVDASSVGQDKDFLAIDKIK